MMHAGAACSGNAGAAAVAPSSSSGSPRTLRDLFDSIEVPLREGQFSQPKPGWCFQPRLHVADSAAPQYNAAREVFEQADNLDDTSLRRHWCFAHAQKIWCNHSEHKALLRDKDNLERMKSSLSWANKSIFAAAAAPIAIELMLKMWSEEYDEKKFADKWASHWRGKPILRCQALNGFPACLPPTNNMLEVCRPIAITLVQRFCI
jgi:hypothetical protein